MKTDDYYDQRDEIVGQTPPWTEEEIECAELAEKVLWKTRRQIIEGVRDGSIQSVKCDNFAEYLEYVKN